MNDNKVTAGDQETAAVLRQVAGHYQRQYREIADVAGEAAEELVRARPPHAPVRSPHEGCAVIRKEFDDLWDLVRVYRDPLNRFDTAVSRQQRADMRVGAIRIAAAALWFALDVCDNQPLTEETPNGDGDSS